MHGDKLAAVIARTGISVTDGGKGSAIAQSCKGRRRRPHLGPRIQESMRPTFQANGLRAHGPWGQGRPRESFFGEGGRGPKESNIYHLPNICGCLANRSFIWSREKRKLHGPQPTRPHALGPLPHPRFGFPLCTSCPAHSLAHPAPCPRLLKMLSIARNRRLCKNMSSCVPNIQL